LHASELRKRALANQNEEDMVELMAEEDRDLDNELLNNS
jgi:hypothetical protein